MYQRPSQKEADGNLEAPPSELRVSNDAAGETRAGPLTLLSSRKLGAPQPTVVPSFPERLCRINALDALSITRVLESSGLDGVSPHSGFKVDHQSKIRAKKT
jgi:hypothetical protein